MKARPYIYSEAIGKIVIKKGENRVRLIIDAHEKRCNVANMGWLTYEELMQRCNLADGTPCGVLI